jgi:hypothetical protein
MREIKIITMEMENLTPNFIDASNYDIYHIILGPE